MKPRMFKPLRPLKPLDHMQNMRTLRPLGAKKWVKAHWRYDYARGQWEWVALTGTPVENRLADLWCIVDGVHSGWLGDLKGFSRRYEAEADIERLKSLRAVLEGAFGGAPALLLRRMKEDELPDLPKAEFHVHEVEMPAGQARAYDSLIANVLAEDRRGAVLEGLQRLRLIALHPDPKMDGSDGDFIDASARLQVCFRSLDHVAARGERALIFLDSLDMQSRLAGIIQRRYGLALAFHLSAKSRLPWLISMIRSKTWTRSISLNSLPSCGCFQSRCSAK